MSDMRGVKTAVQMTLGDAAAVAAALPESVGHASVSYRVHRAYRTYSPGVRVPHHGGSTHLPVILSLASPAANREPWTAS